MLTVKYVVGWMFGRKKSLSPSRERTTTSSFSLDIIPTEGLNSSVGIATRYG